MNELQNVNGGDELEKLMKNMEWEAITLKCSSIKIIVYMIIIFESINYIIEKTLSINFTTIPIIMKIVIMFIVIIVHEFIHFIVGIIFAQNKGKLHFGFIYRKLAFYMNVDGIYNKNGFLFYLIAPFLLSIVLSAICIYYKCMVNLIWQFIFYNIVASTVDILKFINVLYKYRDIFYFKLEEFVLYGSKIVNLN